MHSAIDVQAEATRILAAPKDNYAQLGLRPAAPYAEVKARYKLLCTLHPDKQPNNQLAADAFAVVSAAYTAIRAAQDSQAVPLPSSQPDTQANKWDAFTGRQKRQQAAQQADAAATAVPAEDSCRPGAGCDGSGAWQPSKWGKFQSSSVFIAPTDMPPAGDVGVAAWRSTHKPAWTRPAGTPADQLSTPSSPGTGSTSSTSDSDDVSTQEDARNRWSGAGIRPSAFYVARNRSGEAHLQPAASLYALFGGCRNSHSGGSDRCDGPQQQRLGGFLAAAPSEQHGAAQPLPLSAANSNSRWSSKGKPAELLRQPPVAAVSLPNAAIRGSQPSEEQQRALEGGGRAGKRKRHTRQTVVLSSSSSEGHGQPDGDCSTADIGAHSQGECNGGGTQGTARMLCCTRFIDPWPCACRQRRLRSLPRRRTERVGCSEAARYASSSWLRDPAWRSAGCPAESHKAEEARRQAGRSLGQRQQAVEADAGADRCVAGAVERFRSACIMGASRFAGHPFCNGIAAAVLGCGGKTAAGLRCKNRLRPLAHSNGPLCLLLCKVSLLLPSDGNPVSKVGPLRRPLPGHPGHRLHRPCLQHSTASTAACTVSPALAGPVTSALRAKPRAARSPLA